MFGFIPSPTCISARGFSRLRMSAASCSFSCSIMEAKVTAEAAGGLYIGPKTQGLVEKNMYISSN